MVFKTIANVKQFKIKTNKHNLSTATSFQRLLYQVV